MSNTKRLRSTVTLAGAGGGLVAVAFLSAGLASAVPDDTVIYVPDPATLDFTQVSGMPPYQPEVFSANEDWSLFDLTAGKVLGADVYSGVDTHTAFGSFTNDDFVGGVPVEGAASNVALDLANFGGGWENEWFDPLTGPDAGQASDLLITPMGDMVLFGPHLFEL